MKTTLTPVHYFDGWWAKRDDIAYSSGLEMPSGLKMRQYMGMIANSPPHYPLLVGCSAFAAMQIYVAAAAELTGRKGIVYVPKRKEVSPATQWAIDHGAEVNFVSPGYPSVYRKAARERAKKEGGCVRWDPGLALEDVANQTLNLPTEVKRVVVPTGTGLLAAGVVLGLACKRNTPMRNTSVLAIGVSDLSSKEKILGYLSKYELDVNRIKLEWRRANGKYERPMNNVYLPAGTIQLKGDAGLPSAPAWLDPYYAAKALSYVQSGDCLWVPGRRAKN